MDKYEYRLKAEQIEKLVKRQDYKTAAKISDTIDWRRVKNLNMLYLVADIYEKMERYEDCMEILNIAYDRAPVGRMLLYKMTEIATKMRNFPEAISLYREFVKLAPHDQSKYILKYQIYRERGSAVEDQIRILEDYKSREYQEKWAYELASLYAEAGRIEECVQECDELILWFSEGEYVIKALELKAQYEPLSAAQQLKYDQRLRPSKKVEVQEEDFDDTQVPEFNTDKFSTINLQAELAANLGELLEEESTPEFEELQLPEAEEVPEEETMPEPEFEELQLPEAEEVPEEETMPEPEFEELELPEAEEVPEEETMPEPEFEELKLPEPEGVPEEETMPEPEFEELKLPEAEEVSEEETMPEPEFEELELPESEEIPEEEAMPEPEFEELELPEAEETSGLPEEELRQELERLLEELPTLDVEPVLEDIQTEPEPEKQARQPEETGKRSIQEVLASWESRKAETKAALEAGAEQEKERKEKVMQETAELMKLIEGVSEEIPKDIRQIMEEIDEERKSREETVTEDDLPPDLDEPEEEGPDLSFEDLEIPKPATAKKRKDFGETAALNMIQELERSLASEVSEMAVNAGHLTKEQARLFAYFTSVKGMSQQLSVLFKGSSRSGMTNSSRGNLVITGKRGNGKTTLAIDIVKALQKQDQLPGRRLAKISGQKLNTKDIPELLTKLKSGALIVEGAGALSDAAMLSLSLAMEGDTGGLLVILEDSGEEIQRIFHKNKNFASKFEYTIDIPVFTNDELVAFGKSYAQEKGYVFDEFGILALYDRIGSQQTRTHLVSVAEVKELIDKAVAHAEKRSLRHLFEKVTKRSQDEFGNRLLREEDFLENS